MPVSHYRSSDLRRGGRESLGGTASAVVEEVQPEKSKRGRRKAAKEEPKQSAPPTAKTNDAAFGRLKNSHPLFSKLVAIILEDAECNRRYLPCNLPFQLYLLSLMC